MSRSTARSSAIDSIFRAHGWVAPRRLNGIVRRSDISSAINAHTYVFFDITLGFVSVSVVVIVVSAPLLISSNVFAPILA
jgi:hypothetical protein